MSEKASYFVAFALAIPAVVWLGNMIEPTPLGAFKATTISMLFIAVGFILGYRCATETERPSS